MSIELILSFLLGTASSLFAWYILKRRENKLKQQLRELDAEEELVSKLSRSSVEYSRWYLQSIFAVLFLICSANISVQVFEAISFFPEFPLKNIVPIIFWGAGAGISIQEFIRAQRVRSISKFKTDTQSKRERIKKKLGDDS